MYMYQPLYKGKDPASLWGEAETIVEGSFASQHEPHLVIEPDVVQAYWDTDNYLTIQSKSQNLTESAQSIALACGIPLEKIRMIMNPSGGSFGYTTTANNFALAVTAVQNLDIPVSLTMTYEEHMHTTKANGFIFKWKTCR
jgi:aldehyde oxidoreductase